MSEIKIPAPAAYVQAQWARVMEVMSGQAPDVAYAGPSFIRALHWERDERPKWEGRNWRRIKRERRKHMRARP